MSFQNLIRNPFLSIATTAVMAIILLIFNIILGTDYIAKSAFQSLNEKIDLVVYFKDNVDNYLIKNLTEDLSTLEEVKNVTYTSKEQALEDLGKNHPQTVEFFKKYKLDNPLPASLQITTTSPAAHEKITTSLKIGKYADTLSSIIEENSQTQTPTLENVSKNLVKLQNFTNQVVFWLIAVFLLGGTLIVINAIHLNIYTKRAEISIMRLIGANKGFIKLPFILEGIWYALGALILSTLMLIILINTFSVGGTSLSEYYKNSNFLAVFLAEIVVTLGIGAFGSLWAAHKYIKGKLFINGV